MTFKTSSHVCTYETYVECPVSENVVRSGANIVTVGITATEDTVSFIFAEWKEDTWHCAVGETLTMITPQQQQ